MFCTVRAPYRQLSSAAIRAIMGQACRRAGLARACQSRLLCYGKQARKFLASLPDPLDAGQVTSFMLGYCQGRNTESAKATVTAVRALLRFLHVNGYVPVPAHQLRFP